MIGLGLNVGSARCTATILSQSRSTGGCESPKRSVSHSAALLLHSNGSITFSDAPREPRRGRKTPANVITDYADRVGDPVPIAVTDHDYFEGAFLAARAAQLLYDEMPECDASALCLAVPAAWSEHARASFLRELRNAGLPGPTLVSESEALMAFTEQEYGPAEGLTVTIDIGARYLDIALSQQHTAEGAHIVGSPLRSTEVSGDLFDYLLLTHVLPQVLSENEIADIASAPSAPGTVVEDAKHLRAAVQHAREFLSSRTTAQVVTEFLGQTREIRIVRGETEELFTPSCERIAQLLRRELRAAQISESDVARIVLSGGVAATPLITEFLAREFRIPIHTPIEPALAVSAGAAFMASMGRARVAEHADRRSVPAQPVLPSRDRKQRPVPPILPTLEFAASRRNAGRATAVAGAAAAVLLVAAGSLSLGTSLFPQHSSAGSVKPAQAEAEKGAQESGSAPIGAKPQPVAASSSILGTASRHAPIQPTRQEASQRAQSRQAAAASSPGATLNDAQSEIQSVSQESVKAPSTPQSPNSEMAEPSESSPSTSVPGGNTQPTETPNAPQEPTKPSSPAPSPAPAPATGTPTTNPPSPAPAAPAPPPTTAPAPSSPTVNPIAPVTSGITNTTGAAVGAVEGVTNGVGTTAGNLVQGTTGTVSGVTNTLGGATNGVGGVANTLGAATSGVGNTAGAVTEPVTGTVSGLTGTVSEATGNASNVLGSPLNTVGGVLGGVTGR